MGITEDDSYDDRGELPREIVRGGLADDRYLLKTTCSWSSSGFAPVLHPIPIDIDAFRKLREQGAERVKKKKLVKCARIYS